MADHWRNVNEDKDVTSYGPNPMSFTNGFWAGGIVGGIGGILITLVSVWVLGLIL